MGIALVSAQEGAIPIASLLAHERWRTNSDSGRNDQPLKPTCWVRIPWLPVGIAAVVRNGAPARGS